MKTLAEHILAHPQAPWFAVLDGAQFDDLPSALDALGLAKRALYFEGTDAASARPETAPYVVALDPIKPVVEAVLDLVGPLPAAVFWRCPKGGGALFRHLRTINKVLYPSDLLTPDAPKTAGPFSAAKPKQDHDFVLFRHADANVMAQIVPALDPARLARLFGPADRLVFAAGEDWGGLNEIEPIPGIEAPVGPLKLDADVIDAVEHQERLATRRRIETHLREVGPEYVEMLTPRQLSALVVQSEASGEAMGLETEYGHGLWATMMLMTDGELAHDPEVRAHIHAHPQGPERAIEEALEQIANSSEEDWEDL